jgi:ribosome recycling factor
MIIGGQARYRKEARDEAKKEVDAYKKEKDDEFKKFESEVQSPFSQANARIS